MKYFVLLAAVVSMVLAKPVQEEAQVEVTSDNAGNYKYSFKSKNITIVEERNHDGFVKGSYKYIDDLGKTQTVSYTSGIGGFVASGTTIPVDLPEVTQARNVHLAISNQIRSLLPPLKEDGLVDEEEIVPLSRAALISALEQVANAQDTAEVAAAKSEFLNFYKSALTQ